MHLVRAVVDPGAARLEEHLRERRLVGQAACPVHLDGTVDHVVHLAALYDMTADAAENEDLNVAGTQRVVDVARRIDAGVLHHVSSVAIAGEHRGEFTEEMFDEGQELPSPYHETKFRAEKAVRDSGLRWRVYRPVIVVGDSRTGEMDKVDGLKMRS